MNLVIKSGENEDLYKENNEDFNDDNSINVYNNFEKQNFDFSINDYVSKIRKKLLLIERTNKNESFEESKNSNKKKFQIQQGKKTTMALNISQIPFLKFKINPDETMNEILYIFSKRTRTLNEVIYLQHLLNLFDTKSIFLNYQNDLSDINEVMFNLSICLNLHKYQKNEILFKYGEIKDKLFFLLSGEVALLELVEKKCFMSIEQYIDYLNQLINIGEYDLVRKIIDMNRVAKYNNAIVRIKNNNEKDIKRIIAENMKTNRGINNLHNIASIDFNFNFESKGSFGTLCEHINQNEIIDIDNYKKRIKPPFIIDKGKQIQKKKKLFSKMEENDNENSNSFSSQNKHMIIYYSYEVKKKLSPFNIISDLSLDNENIDKSEMTNLNKRREQYSVTAICSTACTILYLNINTYEKLVKQRNELIAMKNIMSILEVPFFKGLNPNNFKEKYYNFFTLYNYKNGEFIFRQEEKMKYIYFIKSGEIELTMEASLNDINNILEKIENKNNIESKSKDKMKLNNKDKKKIQLINKFKNDTNLIKLRIMRIDYKDVICLNEILDSNDNYYMSAKCISYIGEIFVIKYSNFIGVINDDKSIKNLYLDYCLAKEKLIYERLKRIQNIYIDDKIKEYKNKILKKSILNHLDDINYNNLPKKRNEINLDLINNVFRNSARENNEYIHSDNKIVLQRNTRKSFENEFQTFDSKNSRFILKSAKHQAYKTKINSNKNYKSIYGYTTTNNTKKIKFKKSLSFLDDDKKETISTNKRFNSENNKKVKIKNHKYTKSSSSYFSLIKFKELNTLFKNYKHSDKNNPELNLDINPNFNKYLNNVKKYRLDSSRKPKINPFSEVFFPFKKNNMNIKSNFLDDIRYQKKLKKFNFNKIECLVLDKFIDAETYKKDKEKNEKFLTDKRTLSMKELRRDIKYIKDKKKFPQHLIRRLESGRKINYFPERLLCLQNKKGRYLI